MFTIHREVDLENLPDDLSEGLEDLSPEDGAKLATNYQIEAHINHGRPGRYAGRPEDCYPAEGDEIVVDLVEGLGEVLSLITVTCSKYLTLQQLAELRLLLFQREQDWLESAAFETLCYEEEEKQCSPY